MHKLYALDTSLDFHAPPTRSDLEIAMQGHIITEAMLIGTYEMKR